MNDETPSVFGTYRAAAQFPAVYDENASSRAILLKKQTSTLLPVRVKHTPYG
jgi:hypothetical protein